MHKAVPFVVITSLFVAACGGDDGGETLSKREYIARSNAICQKTSKEAGDQYGKIVGEGRPSRAKLPRFQRFLAEAVVPNLRENLERRRKLPPPEGDKPAIAAIISAGENAVAGFERIAAKRSTTEELWRGQASDPASKYDALSKSYGIDGCGGEE